MSSTIHEHHEDGRILRRTVRFTRRPGDSTSTRNPRVLEYVYDPAPTSLARNARTRAAASPRGALRAVGNRRIDGRTSRRSR